MRSCARGWQWFAIGFLLILAASGDDAEKPPPDPELWRDFGRHLVYDVPLWESSDRIRVVIEIPAASFEKWEVDPVSGKMFWDQKDGKPRRIAYAVPYPANYGAIPQTSFARSIGGDGDPLDAIVLGERQEQGATPVVRVLGVMRLLDDGERDDKLIGVPDDARFEGIESLEDFARRHPQILELLRIFWSQYKLTDQMQVKGFDGPERALETLRETHRAWTERPRPK